MTEITPTKKPALRVIENRRWWYLLSIILILPGVISLFLNGLNVGIDFKGGSLLQVKYSNDRPAIEEIRSKVGEASVSGTSVQTVGDKSVMIRYPNGDGQTPRTDADSIKSKLGDVSEESFTNIGGSVAKDTTKSAATAVVITAFAIIFFIAFSFRGVPKPASSWRFGVSAIVALLHDLLFVAGAFSIIGAINKSIEVDALFITAMLTVLGFSVNDTIVVFDRIRENLRRYPNKNFEEVTNESLNQTMARSLNTSLTVLVVLVSLLLLGGESIRSFILALTLGVAVGTYSSIFNASPFLVSWQNWIDKRSR